jgi:DNA-binding NarL/FixJ family response regulator
MSAKVGPHPAMPAPEEGAEEISVLVVDGQRTVAEALARAMGAEAGIRARSAATVQEATDAVRLERPDVLVMDTGAPGAAEAASSLAGGDPTVPIVVLSDQHDDVTRRQAYESGARVFLTKRVPLDDLVAAIRATRSGGDPLDPAESARLLGPSHRRRTQHASERQRAERLSLREREVLQLMADGASPLEIARRMDITANTLRTHVQNILTKLGVHSRTQAVIVAVRHGKVSART